MLTHTVTPDPAETAARPAPCRRPTTALPAQGASDRPQGAKAGGTLASHAADLGALVRSLPRPPVLAGHSFGGLVVQRCARARARCSACPAAQRMRLLLRACPCRPQPPRRASGRTVGRPGVQQCDARTLEATQLQDFYSMQLQFACVCCPHVQATSQVRARSLQPQAPSLSRSTMLLPGALGLG